jgi:hypothetical protein
MDKREDEAPKGPKPTPNPTQSEREARLAAALRSNLRRRKASGSQSKTS